ncbi:MAG: cadherin repeat domain-containing protein [Gammaproteobacteria bacterium]|nr:cadherin repeat domain-containing protein [Gammaproteobacteria bacterium]MYD00780.1 cadherin repeat domain-containing protein [Gammaproteobacteria bacterium]MYI25422.1 cadherin repeat domain-containing protein [Gammaproteobacteria bacterium]
MNENAAGGIVTSVATENANEVTVDDDRFEVADGNLKLTVGTALNFESDTSPIEVTITASGDGESDAHVVSVSINDVNEAPTISVAAMTTDEAMAAGVDPDLMVAEDSDGSIPGAVVAHIELSDEDTGNTHTLTVSDDRFEAIQAFGQWWLKLKEGADLDYETEDTITLTVTVTDSGDPALSTDSAEVTITVTNVDEAPSAPEVRDGSFSIAENTAGAVITSLADSTDPEGDDITYSVDDERFEITSGLVLKLKDGMSLNFEDGASVDLVVSASDPADNSSQTTVTLTVGDLNEAPSVTADDHAVDENVAGSGLGAITPSDPDAGDTLTIELSGDDRFEARQDDQGGWWVALKDGESLDYETDQSIMLTVTVTDAAGLSASTDVTITVNDVNENPSIDVRDGEVVPEVGATSSLTVDENAMGADLPPLALIEVMDPDAADAGMLTGDDGMMATSVDDDRFEVKLDSVGGLWLALKADQSLDHEAETAGTVDVTVTFTDSAGNTASEVATVMITDLNEAPSVMVQDGATPGGVEASSTVDENVAGAILGEILITDPDDGDTVTPSVTDDRFEVTQDDGGWWLKLKDDASLNYEDSATVDVTVTVTDAEGLTAETVAMITVNDIGESPTAPMPRATELSVDENVAGDVVTVLDSSDPQDDAFTFQVNDSRFEVNDEGVLKLKDDMALDHEAVSSIDLELTATDELGHVSSVTAVTVMVNDMNEKPIAVGMIDDIAANAGRETDIPVDLTALFSDPDDGDAIVRWELSGNPSWLGLSVEYTTDGNGNEQVIGHLRGTPPTTGDESAAAHGVTITASDAGGASGETTFHVVVDDLNDDVTGVNLLDDNGNSIVEVEVDENNASGVVLGEITVDDQDHPSHPNGMHLVVVNDPRFEIKIDDQGGYWLALKEGVSLNHEHPTENGVVDVVVTAIDMNGEQNSAAAQARGADRYKGTQDSATFTVVVNDVNDAPKAGTIGNWWVTVDDSIDQADEVNAGALLSVSLETADDDFPAFTDDDLDAGDRLTYSISGASWVEIDENTGDITNVKGILPGRGVHRVTVTATDSDGESASASFNINVAHSDAAADGTLTGDNAGPKANDATGNYKENSGEVRVATFTVTDLDQDIPDHPFAIKSVEIIRVQNADALTVNDDGSTATGTPDSLNSIDDADTTLVNEAQVTAGYGGAFRLSDPIKNGATWTYHIYARDTDPKTSVNTLSRLSHEDVEEISITVRVTDGTGATDDAEIDININNVNEAPTVVRATPSNPTGTLLSDGTADTPGNLRVNQSEGNKVVLYINLESLWTDDATDADDLIFGASSSASWIEILYGPGKWDDIIKGPDGNTGGGDDLTWGTPGGTNVGRQVGTAPTGATDDSWVVIVEIDRTDRNTQGDQGSFTLTARDAGGATGSVTVPVTVTDENEAIGANAVSISGSTREGSTLRATFNENRDPDLAGAESAAIVLYTWYSGDATSQTDVIQRGTSNELSLTQANVDDYIRVQVTYYEVFKGQFVSNTAGTVEDTTERAISNTPNDGVGSFTIMAGANMLTAAAVVADGDYGRAGVPAANITYSWQMSANGVGGWINVADDDTDPTNNNVLDLDDGEGQYYRAVATYNANNDDDGVDTTTEEMESVYSHAVRVADIRDTANDDTPPTGPTETPAQLTPSGSAFPGGTLSVIDQGLSSVQWQVQRGPNWVDIPGATGRDLSVTSELAGSSVRALATYDSTDPNNPGVTAIVDSTPAAVGGQPSGTAPPSAVADYPITGSVMGSGHARTATANAGDGVLSGHTVTITDMVPLRSLFQDPDTARLTYTAASTTTTISGGTNANGSFVAQVDSGVLVLDLISGDLTYVSDQLRNHDGDPADGTGNVLNLDITADDSGNAGGTSRTSAANTFGDVVIRINVAPTGINFTATNVTAAAGSNLVNTDLDLTEDIFGTGNTLAEVTLNEEVTSRSGEVLATIDVLDQNSRLDPFGTHDVTVTGDDRFMITHTGNSVLGDSDFDGSTWELRLVRGAKFDFETDGRDLASTVDADGDGNPANDKQIMLTLMATDGGGLSTPTPNASLGYSAINLVVTLVNNTVDDPARPGATETPGLKDDEGDGTGSPGTTDDADDTTDNTDDNETDGGDPTPPPPGMSLGGLIEDFIGNMDQGEADLLEDYLLTIDDGLDIA